MKEEQRELILRTEEQLLGSLLIAGTDGTTEAIDAVKRIVRPEDFLPNYLMGQHRRIYEGMLAAIKTDQISVAGAMWDAGTLQKGDITYMSRLVSLAITSMDCEVYARQLADLAKEWQTNRTHRARFKGGI